MKHLYGNIIAAVDVETTGTMFGYHEIIQIAVVPLNQHLEQDESRRFFYLGLAPAHPERQAQEAKLKHRLDVLKMVEECPSQDNAAGMFYDWFKTLDLCFGKKIVPLAHNWAFERGFLTHWLGLSMFDEIFSPHPRDTMLLALSLNDIYNWQGNAAPFTTVGLKAMCNRFQIPLDNAHDALADCIATAKLYNALISSFC